MNLEEKIYTNKKDFFAQMQEFTQNEKYTITPTLQEKGSITQNKYFVETPTTVYRVQLLPTN